MDFFVEGNEIRAMLIIFRKIINLILDDATVNLYSSLKSSISSPSKMHSLQIIINNSPIPIT